MWVGVLEGESVWVGEVREYEEVEFQGEREEPGGGDEVDGRVGGEGFCGFLRQLHC